MATTKKSVKKKPATKPVAKRAPARRAVVAKPIPVKKGDSVKYTSMFAAWKAFWRRGFTEWMGTSSRSEAWLSWLMNILIMFLLFMPSMITYAMNSHPGVWSVVSLLCLVLCAAYGIASIIPGVSMLTRRMHDAGLSAWWWLLYATAFLPGLLQYIWSVTVFVIALLPTKTVDNPYHKYNK